MEPLGWLRIKIRLAELYNTYAQQLLNTNLHHGSHQAVVDSHQAVVDSHQAVVESSKQW